jgi:WD40 repeat protein
LIVNEIRFDSTGAFIYAGCADGRVRRWGAESRELLGEVMIDEGGVYDLNLSPDGGWLAAGGDTGTVVLVDVATLGSIRRFEGHQGPVLGVAFHPGGQRLVSAGADRSIRVWDLETGSELIALREHRRAIQHVQFCPDGQTLASSSDDGTVKLWRTLAR